MVLYTLSLSLSLSLPRQTRNSMVLNFSKTVLIFGGHLVPLYLNCSFFSIFFVYVQLTVFIIFLPHRNCAITQKKATALGYTICLEEIISSQVDCMVWDIEGKEHFEWIPKKIILIIILCDCLSFGDISEYSFINNAPKKK